MVDRSISRIVRRYLAALADAGIHARKAILFGSFARGEGGEFSDIDVIVIAPEFDRTYGMNLVEELWRMRLRADARIEPIPCGEREWETEGGRPILDIARSEGILIGITSPE